MQFIIFDEQIKKPLIDLNLFAIIISLDILMMAVSEGNVQTFIFENNLKKLKYLKIIEINDLEYDYAYISKNILETLRYIKNKTNKIIITL